MEKQIKKVKTGTIKKYDLGNLPQVVQMAKVVKDYIIRNKLFAPITTTNKRTGVKATKNYVMVEGWQFAGGLLGLSPEIVEIKNLTPEGTENYKWLAEAIIIRNKDERKVGRGFALCSKEEDKKKSFDEYAVLSMAQTRAIGKAYRNLIGWVMKLAGYEPTPAEEMENVKEGATKQKSEDIFEKAKKMIKASRNPDGLVEYAQKLSKSGFTAQQKKELNALISSKVDELQN